MAVLSVKGPLVQDSDEAKALACQKAIEFAIDAGFLELMIEEDNAKVMRAISSNSMDKSRLGHVFQDIPCLVHGLRWDLSTVSRGVPMQRPILQLILPEMSLKKLSGQRIALLQPVKALYHDLLSIN